MRKIDVLVLLIGAIGAITWVILSSKDGFKSNNAIIVARSISIASTIDGQVENDLPKTGDRINSEDLIVRIQNARFDRSRWVELESQVTFLEAEIENLHSQQTQLKQLHRQYKRRDKAYTKWMMKEVALKNRESAAALKIATKRQELTKQEVSRATRLFNKKLSSKAQMQIARTEAEVAENQVEMNATQLRRNELMLKALKRDGVFFEDGDTSYWAKMADTIRVRKLDNIGKITTLKTQLAQVKTQAAVEADRMNSSHAEEHRAPFDGMMNAAFVTKGTRVTSGTNLYQILDCTQPAIIIPVPENRISEFSVGLRVTVYPTDSEQQLPGTISYVTSGPLIGADTSLQIQRDLLLNGTRAVVTLDDHQSIGAGSKSQSCETERKAVVVLHTKSWYSMMTAWWASASLLEFASLMSPESLHVAAKFRPDRNSDTGRPQ